MRDLHERGELTDQQAVFFAPKKPREELYDLASDPWETDNLASDPAMSTGLEELRTKLDDWIEDPHPQLGWRDNGAVPEEGTRLFVINQNAAGANTIRFQWDTQHSPNALLGTSYDQVRIRTTQWNGETRRPPVVSTRGFFRDFPAVVVGDSPIELQFD